MPLLRDPGQALLPDSPLFAFSTQRERRALARLGTDVTVGPGSVLTPEGRPGREFFIVKRGEATCSIRGLTRARFEPGDFFGEMALLDGGPRTATVTADTTMELMVFGATEFRSMLENSVGVRQRLLIEMARRLRQADAAA